MSARKDWHSRVAHIRLCHPTIDDKVEHTGFTILKSRLLAEVGLSREGTANAVELETETELDICLLRLSTVYMHPDGYLHLRAAECFLIVSPIQLEKVLRRIEIYSIY